MDQNQAMETRRKHSSHFSKILSRRDLDLETEFYALRRGCVANEILLIISDFLRYDRESIDRCHRRRAERRDAVLLANETKTTPSGGIPRSL